MIEGGVLEPSVRKHLVAAAREMLEALETRQLDLSDEIVSLDASLYTDGARFDAERQKIFRALPLMLAASCELATAGDFKTLDVAGVPVLLTRTSDGTARAFLNSCRHRAGPVACDKGNASRFTCPYHGWTYSNQGALVGIASSDQYGAPDKKELGLIELPLHESAGLIWVVLDPDATPNFAGFLGGLDDMLEGFGLKSWSLYHQCALSGANWKLAFDAHLEFYHLPVLHKETFGTSISNLAQYYFHGPHQRLGLLSEKPADEFDLRHWKNVPDEQWPIETLLFGEWIVFPNVSLNCFDAGEKTMVISQVFPGDSADTSLTVQTYLVARPPTDATKPALDEFVAFIKNIVGQEDLPMSRQQQKTLASGLMKQVQFGRNERGLQHFHRWLERIVEGKEIEFF